MIVELENTKLVPASTVNVGDIIVYHTMSDILGSPLVSVHDFGDHQELSLDNGVSVAITHVHQNVFVIRG